MRAKNFDDQFAGVSTLSEPVRWELYRYVSLKRRPVSRDEAARAAGISRALAAFHLDKLVDEGFLEVSFQRLTKRTGPGAGRPAKLYARSGREVAVSIPERRYDLAGLFLVRAAANSENPTLPEVNRVAREFGESIGQEARRKAGKRFSKRRLTACAVAELSNYGFDPMLTPSGDILLANCPFHALAQENRELVCGMNLALMEGMLEGLRLQGIEARLEPQADMCCVAFRKTGSEK